MPESVQSCFELSIHLSVSEPAVNCSKDSSREKKKVQGNVWKVQNTTGRFLAQRGKKFSCSRILTARF